MLSIVLGLIELFVGIYGLAGVLKMKNKRMISGGFLPRAAKQSACRDIDGVIHFLMKRQFAFSIYCVANGIVTILDGQHEILPNGLNLTLAFVFIIVAYQFSSVIRKTVKTYFY